MGTPLTPVSADAAVQPIAELFSVRDRVAVVTGATAGLGERMAAVLHGAGARVVVAGRRRDRLEALEEQLPGAVAVQSDAASDADLQRLVATTEQHFGSVEILVNNAATVFANTAQGEPRDEIEETLAVNLVAPMRLSQLVYEGMAARGRGSIINITSIVGQVGMGGRLPQASYAASKGGLAALTRELAAQWARDGIRVNAIAPGFFRSEITAPLFDNERLNEFILRNSLIKRVGEPSDFDGALLYLASDASAFVTGQTVTVDGGWTAR